MDDWFKGWFDEDYARLYTHRDEEEAKLAVATALRIAPELAKGPVLDLACGSGRHLQVLRQTNALAFGLDLSPHLLARTTEDLRPFLVRGDMRQLPIKGSSLSGICLWFTAFGYFSDAENRELLLRMAASLKPGGVLLLDYFNAVQLEKNLVAEDEMEQNGVRVVSRRSIQGNHVIKQMMLYRIATGESRQAIERVRIYRPEELKALAFDACFHLRQSIGNYEGTPFIEHSPRWIGIFIRA